MKYLRKIIFLLCILGLYLSYKYNDLSGLTLSGFILIHNGFYDIGGE